MWKTRSIDFHSEVADCLGRYFFLGYLLKKVHFIQLSGGQTSIHLAPLLRARTLPSTLVIGPMTWYPLEKKDDILMTTFITGS